MRERDCKLPFGWYVQYEIEMRFRNPTVAPSFEDPLEDHWTSIAV